MKHVQIDQNGYYRYRRRVPEAAKAFVGKTEFVKVLGKTESEALSHYGDVLNSTQPVASLKSLKESLRNIMATML